jgi:tetratricopeptide (TPR) repeat protein
MDKVKTIVINIAVIAAISLALIWGNTLYRQHSQFAKGEAALAAGDFTAAVAGYESAIHMYTPFSSLVERAAERLWVIGEGLAQRGDRERALIAYRSLRSSFYAVRGLTAPGKEWIARCDERIAQLVKQSPATLPSGAR